MTAGALNIAAALSESAAHSMAPWALDIIVALLQLASHPMASGALDVSAAVSTSSVGVSVTASSVDALVACQRQSGVGEGLCCSGP
jgi:hypothetical protein